MLLYDLNFYSFYFSIYINNIKMWFRFNFMLKFFKKRCFICYLIIDNRLEIGENVYLGMFY